MTVWRNKNKNPDINLIRLQGAAAILLVVLYLVLPGGRESQMPLLHFIEGLLTGLFIISFFRVSFRRAIGKGDGNGKV